MWDSFYSMFRLGMMHIADGADHLLFLCSLIMVAPCVALNGKWEGSSNWWYTLKRTLLLVTGFTIGHSLSLIFGSLGWIKVQTTWVEVLIAVSVAFMAMHSIKPVIRKGELVVTTFFGLIHGLAFASIMQELSESTQVVLVELLGFNLGIEAYQVLVLVMMIPLVLLASRFPQYNKLRVGVGVFTLVAATIWIWQRITLQENALTQWLEALPDYKWVMPMGIGLGVIAFKINAEFFKSK